MKKVVIVLSIICGLVLFGSLAKSIGYNQGWVKGATSARDSIVEQINSQYDEDYYVRLGYQLNTTIGNWVIEPLSVSGMI